MEFKLSKKEMNDLLRDWIIFRDDELSKLSAEDKGHLIDFDKHAENIMRNVADCNKKYV